MEEEINLTIEKTVSEKPSQMEAWEQFIHGNDHAIVPVFEKCSPKLLAIAYGYLRNRENSKDVVSGVFEKLLTMSASKRKDQLSYASDNLDNFLAIVVKNQCLNQIEKERNRNNILKSLWKTQRTEPDNLFEEDMKIIIGLLPGRQKTVFEMHYAGYKNPDIAKELGISENTVKNTLVNGKKKIRSLYRTFMIR